MIEIYIKKLNIEQIISKKIEIFINLHILINIHGQIRLQYNKCTKHRC